jgi:predicted short-subunit dehydrogenase-like oxidoreductase (DUF2520 family)
MKMQLPLQYLVIGSGRTARHMIRYLELLKIPYHSWNRREAISQLNELLKSSSHILLAISDKEIQSFAETYLKSQKNIIHFSGALVIPGLIDAHPLMTFTEELYDLEIYQSMSFITSSEKINILPGLENQFFKISPDKKALYHALCVSSGNFTTLLWQKMKSGLEEMGIPFSAAHPYLRQIMENLISHPDQALTGPIARKDFLTIQKNEAAFANDSFQEIYRAFISTYVPESQI